MFHVYKLHSWLLGLLLVVVLVVVCYHLNCLGWRGQKKKSPSTTSPPPALPQSDSIFRKRFGSVVCGAWLAFPSIFYLFIYFKIITTACFIAYDSSIHKGAKDKKSSTTVEMVIVQLPCLTKFTLASGFNPSSAPKIRSLPIMGLMG